MRRGESDTGVTLPRAPARPSVSWAAGIQPLAPTMQASEDRDQRTPVPTGLPGGGSLPPGLGSGEGRRHRAGSRVGCGGADPWAAQRPIEEGPRQSDRLATLSEPRSHLTLRG